jgi:hypothetical protein
MKTTVRALIPRIKLRIYAIFLTVILVAVLVNPSAEQHYAKLEQFYPWVNEALLLQARIKFSEGKTAFDFYDSPNDVPHTLTYKSFGVLSTVHTKQFWEPCFTYLGPHWPTSIGFLGHVFAKRPTTPEELQLGREQERQVRLDKLSHSVKENLSLEPSSDLPREISTPRAKDLEVSVMSGGSVQIPLRGFERNLNRLEYGIIGQPRYGRLSNLAQYNGPDRQGPGWVTYTHANDDNSTSDTFDFEVRSPPSNLRGRGRITIRILGRDTCGLPVL